MSLSLYIDLNKASLPVGSGGANTPKPGGDVAAPKLEGPPEGSYNWDGKGDPGSRGFKQAANGTWYKMPGDGGKAEQPSEEGKVDPEADVAAEKQVEENQSQSASAEMAEPDSIELDGSAAELQRNVDVARQSGNEAVAAQLEEKLAANGGMPDQREAGTGEAEPADTGEADTGEAEPADTGEADTGEAEPAASSKDKKASDAEKRKEERSKNQTQSKKDRAIDRHTGMDPEVDRSGYNSRMEAAAEAEASGDYDTAIEESKEAWRELGTAQAQHRVDKANEAREVREAAKTATDAKAAAAAKDKLEASKKKAKAASEAADAKKKADIKKAEDRAADKAAKAKAAAAKADKREKAAIKLAEDRAAAKAAKAKDAKDKKKAKDELEEAKKAAKAIKDADRKKAQEEAKKAKDELKAAKDKAAKEREDKRIEAAKLRDAERAAATAKREKAREARQEATRQKAHDVKAGKAESLQHKLNLKNAKVDPGVDRTVYNEYMDAAESVMDTSPETASELLKQAEEALTSEEQDFKRDAKDAADDAKEEAKIAKEDAKIAKEIARDDAKAAKEEAKTEKEIAKQDAKEEKAIAKEDAAEEKGFADEAKAKARADQQDAAQGKKDSMADFKTGMAAGKAAAKAPLKPGAAAPVAGATVQAGVSGAAKLGHHLLTEDEDAVKEDEKAGGTAQSSLGKSMREVSLDQVKLILRSRGVDLTEKDYSLNSVRSGAEEELEHTDDVNEATKIAIDHLEEKPHYYKRLDVAMETPLKELMALDDTKKALNGIYIDLHKAGAISNSSSSSAGDSSDPYQAARQYNESFSERRTGTGAAVPADSVAKVDEENSLQAELESEREQDSERSKRQGLTPDEEKDEDEDEDDGAQKSIGLDFQALANVARVVKSIKVSRVTSTEMEFLTTELGYTLEDVEKGVAKIAGRNRDRFSRWLCGRMHKSINVLR